MGTHPIFESDFDCLTERGLTIEMLSRVSRPIAQKLIQKRFGGTFAYFVQKTGNRVWENEHNNFQLRYIVRGVLIGFGLGLGLQIIFGVPEGPYYYDPEQYTPEEYELVQTALGRFLYKYWFTTCAESPRKSDRSASIPDNITTAWRQAASAIDTLDCTRHHPKCSTK